MSDSVRPHRLDPIKDATVYLIVMLLKLVLAVTVSYLVLMTMKVLKSIGELFGRMSLSLEFSVILLVISQGLCVFKRKMTEAKCHFSWHHIKGIYYQNDISLVILPSTI